MKKKEERKVSTSISHWSIGALFITIMCWVGIGLAVAGPFSKFWISVGGDYITQAYALTMLFCVLGVLLTMIVELYFLNRLERAATSYEDSLWMLQANKEDLQNKLAAIAKNLQMSDIDLIRCTEPGSSFLKVSGINYYIPPSLPSADEIRTILEAEKRKVEEKLNSLTQPEEPLKVARWRRWVMGISDPVTA